MDRDSCWAREPETLTISSVVSVPVSIFSFSNRTVTPRRESSRREVRHSFVLRAKRATDFTKMRSILPFRQSRIIRLVEHKPYNGIQYSQILRDLQYKGGDHCHLDPDLDLGRRRERIDGWFPAFGQRNAAAAYLKNIGVAQGDIFLFFGNFHFVEYQNGTYRYLRDRSDFYRGKDLQVIWGYLQVGEIISVPEEQRKVWWHPHSSNGRADNSTNVIFKAAERLSLDKSKPGAGVLRFDKKRVLTLKGATKATWARNEVYDETHIYGKRSNCAKNPDSGLYYAGIWQELGLKESDACTEWARNILL